MLHPDMFVLLGLTLLGVPVGVGLAYLHIHLMSLRSK